MVRGAGDWGQVAPLLDAVRLRGVDDGLGAMTTSGSADVVVLAEDAHRPAADVAWEGNNDKVVIDAVAAVAVEMVIIIKQHWAVIVLR